MNTDMLDAGMRRDVRSRVGLLLEVLAVCFSVGVAVALTRDGRATALHVASVWVAVGVAVIPPVLSLLRARGAVAGDVIAALLTLSAIGGSYTIGGLALLFPAGMLLVAALLHYVATPAGAQALGVPSGRFQLVAAAVLGSIGAFFGLAWPLMYAGWIFSLVAIGLFGAAFARRRQRRGRSSAVGWVFAVLIVLGLNVVSWILALSLVAIL